MLKLKGKLRRLSGGRSREDFLEWTKANAHARGFVYSPSNVRAMVAGCYVVRPEFVAEVAAFVQMLCDATAITKAQMGMWQAYAHFDLTPVRFYNCGQHTLAVETTTCWIVYPLNLRHTGWLLNRRRVSHG